MKNRLIKGIVVTMGLLVALVSAGLAEPESAKQQLNSTAKNTAKFDGGQGSTSNTSVSTKTTAPTVNVSSQTATGDITKGREGDQRLQEVRS